MMIVADKNDTYVLTGNGDVVEPDKLLSGSSIIAIGSGGNFALSAALAMDDYEKDAEVLAKKSMSIANKLCVFTNDNLTVETLKIK
jgi:ATP-dependent HslUV protease subunit HslV